MAPRRDPAALQLLLLLLVIAAPPLSPPSAADAASASAAADVIDFGRDARLCVAAIQRVRVFEGASGELRAEVLPSADAASASASASASGAGSASSVGAAAPQPSNVSLLASVSLSDSSFYPLDFVPGAALPLTLSIVALPRAAGLTIGTLSLTTGAGARADVGLRMFAADNAFRVRPVLARRVPASTDFSALLTLHNPSADETLVVREVSTHETFISISPAEPVEDGGAATEAAVLAASSSGLWRVAPLKTAAIARIHVHAHAVAGLLEGFVPARECLLALRERARTFARRLRATRAARLCLPRAFRAP